MSDEQTSNACGCGCGSENCCCEKGLPCTCGDNCTCDANACCKKEGKCDPSAECNQNFGCCDGQDCCKKESECCGDKKSDEQVDDDEPVQEPLQEISESVPAAEVVEENNEFDLFEKAKRAGLLVGASLVGLGLGVACGRGLVEAYDTAGVICRYLFRKN